MYKGLLSQRYDTVLRALSSNKSRGILPSTAEAFNTLQNKKKKVEELWNIDIKIQLEAYYLIDVWIGEAQPNSWGDVNLEQIAEDMYELERNLTIDELKMRFEKAGVQLPLKMAIKLMNLKGAITTLLSFESNTLDIKLIQRLHFEIGKNGLIPSPGKFRTKRVKPAGSAFEYIHPNKIISRLNILLTKVNDICTNVERPLNLTEACALGTLFLSEFLIIHPFINGNGRTARLLLNHLLRDHIGISMSLFGHDYDRSMSQNHYQQERDLYLRVLNARLPLQSSPIELGFYLFESLQETYGTLLLWGMD